MYLNMNIDINCDVGEGIGNEAELFPFISSCNLACGGHAGDETTMQAIVSLAKRHQVEIGAHPSYPDKSNFGRISMDLNLAELLETIQTQVANLVSVCEKEHVKLHHIKAHGALYNDTAKGGPLALTFLKAIEEYKAELYLYVPSASFLAQMASEQGFKIKREAFGDRNYNEDLSLVSRKQSNAIISEPSLVFEHLYSMVQNQQVRTVSGVLKTIVADTYCIHGDTPNALQILMYLSEELPKKHIYLQK